MTSAVTPKFTQLIGEFALRNITTGEAAHTRVFDSTSADLNLAVTIEKVKGTTDERGTIFTYETDRASTLSFKAKSRHPYLLNALLMANSVARAAATDVAVTVPAMTVGQDFFVGAKNISSVVLAGKVENVDYIVKPKSGVIRPLIAFDAPVTGTYSNAAFSEGGIFNAASQYFEILFTSETTGQTYIFYAGLMTPSGNLALVAESGIGEADCKFELIQSPNAVPDPLLGKLGRIFYS